MIEQIPETVQFNVPNLETAETLLRHQQKTGEVFSPLPVSLAVIDGVEDVQAAADAIAEIKGPNVDSYARAAVIDIAGSGTAEAVHIHDQGYFDQDRTEGALPPDITSLNEIIDSLTPSLASFGEIAYADAQAFLQGHSRGETPPTHMEVDIFWSQQRPYILDHWKPASHIDGTGWGNWTLVHSVSVGSPTLHYPGVYSHIRPGVSPTQYETYDQEPIVFPSGTVTRMHRTSLHAGPLRFEGARLFFRARSGFGYLGR